MLARAEADDRTALPYDAIKYVWTHLPRDDPLRQLILYAMTYVADHEILLQELDQLPGRFLLDLAATASFQDVAPFSEMDDALIWLGQMTDDFCKRWHSHKDE